MLNEALKNWADWGLLEKPSLIKVFEGGLNHHTALIESNNTQFVLKVFKHSFNPTIKAEYFASEIGVSPQLHMAANNVALYEFIEDQGFTHAYLGNLAKTLELTHQSKATGVGEFDLLTFCDNYLVSANSDIHDWHTALTPALTEFIEDPTPWVFCHNDLVTQNCMFNQGNTILIDWEFAQYNNPWFDLAAIIHYFELSTSQAREFLSCYKRGWQKKMGTRVFQTAQVAVLWCDLLWSMHTLGKDYKHKNQNRFKQLSDLAATVNITLPE